MKYRYAIKSIRILICYCEAKIDLYAIKSTRVNFHKYLCRSFYYGSVVRFCRVYVEEKVFTTTRVTSMPTYGSNYLYIRYMKAF